MDKLDYQIISELRNNARQTASDISKTIHLSVSTVIERIKKMEKSGLIEMYTAIINDEKAGNAITVMMEVSMDHPVTMMNSSRLSEKCPILSNATT